MTPGGEHTQGRLDDQGSTQSILVPAITLGDLHAKIAQAPFVLVADIEGAEFEMLDHDIEAMKCCQYAIIEVHGSREKQNDFIHKMRALGLELEKQKHSVCTFRRFSGAGSLT